MPQLTVGIPTFNRHASVLRQCSALAPLAHRSEIALLVVDDGSTDATPASLAVFAGPNVTLVRHDANAGYASAFATMLESVATEFVLLAADDDVVHLEPLARLCEWLPGSTVDLVCTQRSHGDRRPDHGGIWPLAFTDYRAAASHAPGLVFRMSAVGPAIRFLRAQLDAGNPAALTYPQSVVAAWVLAEGTGSWWNEIVVEDEEELPSGILDPSGLPYWAPMSRLQQAFGFDAVLIALAATVPSDEGRARLARLRELNARTLYPALRNAFIESGVPRSGTLLDRATLRQLAAGTVRRLHL